MIFNKSCLETYRTLIQTTELQKGYQEFIKLFRFLRIELEKAMPEYIFSGHIVENNMDFAYFQMTNEQLKSMGIKIQVIFVHREFCFEIWASGYNRKIQCEYCEKLKNKPIPFLLNDNPNRVDYILKAPINKNIDIADSSALLAEIQAKALELVEYVKRMQLSPVFYNESC